MDTALIFAAFVGTLYALLAFARNHFSETKKTPKELLFDTISVFGLVLASNYILDTFGYASIISMEKTTSTKAFTTKPEF